jgi:hypothetical protein
MDFLVLKPGKMYIYRSSVSDAMRKKIHYICVRVRISISADAPKCISLPRPASAAESLELGVVYGRVAMLTDKFGNPLSPPGGHEKSDAATPKTLLAEPSPFQFKLTVFESRAITNVDLPVHIVHTVPSRKRQRCAWGRTCVHRRSCRSWTKLQPSVRATPAESRVRSQDGGHRL